MATEKEVFRAVRTIKEYCDSMSEKPCCACPVWRICDRCFVGIPDEWPDLEEGGVKVEKNICFECKYASEYPECPATNDDIVFANNGDTIVSCKAYEEVKGGTDNG